MPHIFITAGISKIIVSNLIRAKTIINEFMA